MNTRKAGRNRIISHRGYQGAASVGELSTTPASKGNPASSANSKKTNSPTGAATWRAGGVGASHTATLANPAASAQSPILRALKPEKRDGRGDMTREYTRMWRGVSPSRISRGTPPSPSGSLLETRSTPFDAALGSASPSHGRL